MAETNRSERSNKSEIAQDIHSDQVADNLDAQLVAEAVETGQQDVADVDVKADYEASKQFSVGHNTESTASKFGASQPGAAGQSSGAAGDPADFVEMAKEVVHPPEDENAGSSPAKSGTEQQQTAQ